MIFTLEQFVAAEPAAVWPYLTVPEFMNQWSTAGVRFLTPGDGDEPWAIGAVRRITIKARGRQVAFDEVIQVAEPPQRLVYRVFEGIPARYHRGEITLVPQAGGTLVRWEVAYEFPLPGMAQGAALILKPQLKESLRRLAVEAGGARPQTYRQDTFVDDSADELAALFAAAETIRDEQEALADELAASNDPKRWFARVYQFVTEAQINACRKGVFAHPGWVLRLIPRFHHYYIKNLEVWSESPVFAEHHWASSFHAAEMARRWNKPGGGEFGYSIAKGMQAHIEEDLPRTLAEIYFWYYKDKCRYGRFRADYLLMSPIFREAAMRMLDTVPPEEISVVNRLFMRLTPDEFKDRIMARLYYDIARERRRAYERGERLAKLMEGAVPGNRPAAA